MVAARQRLRTETRDCGGDNRGKGDNDNGCNGDSDGGGHRQQSTKTAAKETAVAEAAVAVAVVATETAEVMAWQRQQLIFRRRHQHTLQNDYFLFVYP